MWKKLGVSRCNLLSTARVLSIRLADGLNKARTFNMPLELLFLGAGEQSGEIVFRRNSILPTLRLQLWRN